MKVCAYCRVSTSSEAQETSYENQRSYFQRKVTEAGHELVAIYADQGITGTKLLRPEFNRMLSDAGLQYIEGITTDPKTGRKIKGGSWEVTSVAPKFDEIWVKNTSRFARSLSSTHILDALTAKGVGVFFVEQGFNTKDNTTRIALAIYQVLDEAESRDKSSKTRFGNEESAKKGGIRSSPKLYGYKYNPADKSFTIIPDEVENIRYIFNLYRSGIGVRSICTALRNEHRYTRNGKPFCKSTVRRILDNEKYAGLNNPLKYETGEVFTTKHSPKVRADYMERVKPNEKIPAIISQEDFFYCRELLHSKVNYQKNIGVYNGISKYAGLLYCGLCGAKYYANKDKGRAFYNCSARKTLGTEYCPGVNVSEAEVDRLLERMDEDAEYIYQQEVEITSNIIFSVIKETITTLEQSTERKEQASKLQEEIEATERHIRSLLRLSAEDDDFVQLKEVVQEDREAIAEKRKQRDDLLTPVNSLINRLKLARISLEALGRISVRGSAETGLPASTSPLSNGSLRQNIERIIVDLKKPLDEDKPYPSLSIKLGRFTVFFKFTEEILTALKDGIPNDDVSGIDYTPWSEEERQLWLNRLDEILEGNVP